MCLTTVYPKEKIIKEGVGYKVFIDTEKGLMPCFFWRGDRKVFKIKKWMKEKEFRHSCLKGNKFIEDRYPFGFHLFKRKKDAKYFNRFSPTRIIKKVEFRKGCAIGLNDWACKNLETIVAKEIFVPK